MPDVSSVRLLFLQRTTPTSFGLRLSLSDDNAVETILSDIPLLSVGLLSFGAFTFFLALKRLDRPAIYLYTSALLGFVAAILDLSQVLVRGTVNTDDGTDLDSVSGLIMAREIGLALSFGFRYLFLWSFVSERPRGEPPPLRAPPSDSGRFDVRNDFHSADWRRWGILGLILKWSLLAQVIAIALMQIIWRTVKTQDQYGPLYMAEATVQIVASALFLMKLKLNIFLSPFTPLWRPLRYFAAPMVATLMSIGIGIGNLDFFTFSETTLGRFLQAVEVYILIVFMLINRFYVAPTMPSRTRPAEPLPSLYLTRPEGIRQSVIQMSSPVVEKQEDAPEEVVVIGRHESPKSLGPSAASRASTVSRLSSWIMTRAMSRRQSKGEGQLWNQDEAERGESPFPDPQPSPVESVANLSPRVMESKEGRTQIMLTPRPIDTPQADQSSFDLRPPPPLNATGSTGSAGPLRDSFARPVTGFSLGSYYGIENSARASTPFAMPSQLPESPIYGLNGIVERNQQKVEAESRALAAAAAARPPIDSGVSVISFEELLRQQTELDKSIAALRLFSPRTSITSVPPPPAVPVVEKKDPSLRTTSTSTTSLSKPESASGRSEFSLSIFPEPPEDPSALSLVSPTTTVAMRAQRQSRARNDSTVTLAPIKVFSEDPPAVPLSASQDPAIATRFDSAGTQYDVTSFIGDLTVPNALRISTALTDVESGDESPSTATIQTARESTTKAIKPLFLNSAVVLPPVTSAPATASSGVLTSTTRTEQQGPPPLKPLLLGLAARRQQGRQGLPPRPRLTISGPRPPPQDGMGDQAPGAFERPRPPPLIIKESNLRESRAKEM